jgi:glycosyltransferase involved in cell wall biosynthesis
MNINITAIVFARNEENRILSIFQNLKDFCEIIVFDGGSTDGTEEICKQNNIKFVQRPKGDTWSERVNSLPWVYENTPTEYVLHVYGSHHYPRQLLELFSSVANENSKTAIFHDVVIYRYGDVVHRPTFRRISSACVFCKKSTVDFSKSKIHDEFSISFDEKKMVRLPGRDELSLHLFQDEDCESFTKKTINYVAIEARQRFATGERMTGSKLFFGPLGRLIYQFFRTGSYSKGSKGLVYSILNLIYDFNVSIILWELTNQLTYEDAVTRNNEKKSQLFKLDFEFFKK